MNIKISSSIFKKFQNLEECQDLGPLEAQEYLQELVDEFIEEFVLERTINHKRTFEDYDDEE